MKKILTILGAISLVVIVALVAFAGFTAFQGRELDASSKAYIEANIPPILSTWSKDELLKRSSPQLLKILNEKPDQLDLLFQKFAKLGGLRSFDDIRGDANISYTTQEGKVVTAAYQAHAKFENGEGRVSIRLVQVSGQWQLLLININSPLFLAP